MKRIQLNIEDFFEVPSAVIYSPEELNAVYNVTIDSRKLKKNSLFIAIKGKNYDGHNFVQSAVENGASAILINEKKIADFDEIDVPIITVKDTIKALGDVAKIWRKKISAKVVAITGSSGKTTVKDMLADLLSVKFSVSKTLNNNNNTIGVPLTILNTNEKHQVLVAEVGTNHFGEIPYSAKIISPDYALITNIGQSHIQYLRNKKGVWKEKSALFDETIKNNGKLFINSNDEFIKKYRVAKNKCVTYGTEKGSDIVGTIKKYSDYGKSIIELKGKGKTIKTRLPFYGEQNVSNFIAAASVAMELGLKKSELLNGIKKIKLPAGRLKVFRLKNSLVIDDTYNANPESANAAIELVGKIDTKKQKILFLGDMLELGKSEVYLHKELAKVIGRNKIDTVYTIGKLMKYLHEVINKKSIIAEHFRTRNSLITKINNVNLNNAVILVKGSRRMRMEEFLAVIKERLMN